MKVLATAGLDKIKSEAQVRMFIDGIRGAKLHDAVFDINGLEIIYWAKVDGNDEFEVVRAIHTISGVTMVDKYNEVIPEGINVTLLEEIYEPLFG